MMQLQDRTPTGKVSTSKPTSWKGVDHRLVRRHGSMPQGTRLAENRREHWLSGVPAEPLSQYLKKGHRAFTTDFETFAAHPK
jgi:hypothetical protein